MITPKSSPNPRHTHFLQYLEDGIKDQKLGICALAPVKAGQTLAATMPDLAEIRWNEKPYLRGGCMMINKTAFSRIGYFDEQIPCYIDREYSQRAMKAGINVGYASYYCVIHLGEKDQLLQKIPFTKTNPEYLPTKWDALLKKIERASQYHTIVNLI